MHQPMSCCSILYPVNLRKNVTVISYCSFILDRHVRKVFFFSIQSQARDKEKMLSHEESNLRPLRPDALQLSHRDSKVS